MGRTALAGEGDDDQQRGGVAKPPSGQPPAPDFSEYTDEELAQLQTLYDPDNPNHKLAKAEAERRLFERLLNPPTSALNDKNKSQGKKVQSKFDYPPPETETELNAIQ